MTIRDATEAKLAPIIEAASNDHLVDLWKRRHDVAPPSAAPAVARKCTIIVEGLVLAAMRDRGLGAPPRAAASPAPDPPNAAFAKRNAEIVDAVLAGQSSKAVAHRFGLHPGTIRRIVKPARGDPAKPRPAPRVEPDGLTAAERVLGQSWRDALPDDRLPVHAGDDIPKPTPPELAGLFYEGKLNVIAGAPGTGKSYIALKAADEAHTAGRVLWLDAEDSAETFATRCLQLSCAAITRSDNVVRVNHSDWIAAAPEHIAACYDWLANGLGPGLAVIDSGTSSGSGDSLDQWQAWKKNHLPDHRRGLTVILVEHVTKSPEDRWGQSAGSRGKLVDVTGLHAQIDELEGTGWAPATDTTPPRAGGYGVHCSKNKPGGNGWIRGDRLGVLYGEPHPDGTLTVGLVVGGRARSLVDAVAAWVEDNPGKNTSAVVEAVPGRKKDVAAAVRKAEADGRIVRNPGANRAKICWPPDPEQPGGYP